MARASCFGGGLREEEREKEDEVRKNKQKMGLVDIVCSISSNDSPSIRSSFRVTVKNTLTDAFLVTRIVEKVIFFRKQRATGIEHKKKKKKGQRRRRFIEIVPLVFTFFSRSIQLHSAISLSFVPVRQHQVR